MPLAPPKIPVEETVILPSKDENGTPIFALLVKRTFDIHPGHMATRAEQTYPLVKVDRYYDSGDAETSTVREETDLIPYKIATDVVVIGRAHAPNGEAVAEMTVGVKVGDSRKVIRVFGDRLCVFRPGLPPDITDPEPFTTMEIRYDRAYGGQDACSNPNLPFYYPRNQRGPGVAVTNLREVVDGLPLPNLEDPLDLLTPERIVFGETERWVQQPLPQGLGWFQRTWYPRCSFVGSVPGSMDPDTVLKEERLGLVPRGQMALARQFKLPSFDVRFNSGASPGLAVPFLEGGELVQLVGLASDGELRFELPTEAPRMSLDIGLGIQELLVVLHTVCIRMEDMQVDLVWRGAHPYPGIDWLPEMKRMVAEVV
jgi:hypothetical protein